MANKIQQSFKDNRPTKGKLPKNKIKLDTRGNPISPDFTFSGEIIQLQKRHYGQSSVSELLDRSFSEIAKTRENQTPENFFNLYNQLFFDIPKEGKLSHTFLIEESTNYIGGYEDPKGDKVNSLIDRVVELEQLAVNTSTDHPLFRNGTAIRGGSQLGIMQEGKLRRVSNAGDPSPYSQLKKTLGLMDPRTGEPLPDKESWTEVSSQTWDSLPKWPSGTTIDASADWSMTLSQFNIAVSNITIITDTVEQSELDSNEIQFLIEKLKKKTPYLGNTIEDNFNGTIEYTTEDLLPFNFNGTSLNETKVLYKKEGISVSISNRIRHIVEKWEARDDKGVYGLADNTHPKSFAAGHMSNLEIGKEHDRLQLIGLKQQYQIQNTFGILGETEQGFINRNFNASNITNNNYQNSSIFESNATAGTPGYYGYNLGGVYYVPATPGTPNTNPNVDTHEYGIDWKSQMIEELEEMREEVNDNQFVRYYWKIDGSRSFNQTTLDGAPVFSGQYYWVEDETDSVPNWARSLLNTEIAKQKDIYGNHAALSQIEDQ